MRNTETSLLIKINVPTFILINRRYQTCYTQHNQLHVLTDLMTTRGRPSKKLSHQDIEGLKIFLQDLPFLKKNQHRALTLLDETVPPFSEQQLTLLKTVDRERRSFQQRQLLIENIQLKQKNQQTLLANEIEILGLLKLDLTQDTFFRLDRALESYQKIEKAALENRIRLEDEKHREILQNNKKELTTAQKKRNAENQLKYALGGAVLAAYEQLGISSENLDPQIVKSKIVHNERFYDLIKDTKIFKDTLEHSENDAQACLILPKLLDAMIRYKIAGEPVHLFALRKLNKP